MLSCAWLAKKFSTGCGKIGGVLHFTRRSTGADAEKTECWAGFQRRGLKKSTPSLLGGLRSDHRDDENLLFEVALHGLIRCQSLSGHRKRTGQDEETEQRP